MAIVLQPVPLVISFSLLLSVVLAAQYGLYPSKDLYSASHQYSFCHFIQVELCIRGDCGPTVSFDVTEMICSMPSLKEVSLQAATFHHCFFETLARKGKESKVSSSSTIVSF